MPVTMAHGRRHCRKVFTFDIIASHHVFWLEAVKKAPDRNGEATVHLQPTRTGSRIERLEDSFENDSDHQRPSSHSARIGARSFVD